MKRVAVMLFHRLIEDQTPIQRQSDPAGKVNELTTNRSIDGPLDAVLPDLSVAITRLIESPQANGVLGARRVHNRLR